ncbi:MAG: hypothetical protein QNJ20_08030 [Paracoccaceae bacterium]|nr:hypothetical protein [Paracoccaceae bacterium]
MRRFAVILLMVVLSGPVLAEDKLVRVQAPQALMDTGLLKFALPRFSLKTQVRIEYVPEGAEADLVIGDTGRAIFQGPNQVWKMDVRSADHPGTKQLADWLASDVGQRTIASYAPDGTTLFGPPQAEARVVVEVTLDGDAELGHKVSREKCTRCHAVDEATKGWGIGSTPSFGVLRSLHDWEGRFAAFYALNPHPAFTQIEDVTDPFPMDRPSPIAPVELTFDELQAMLAYVAAMPAADLGKPLDHQ